MTTSITAVRRPGAGLAGLAVIPLIVGLLAGCSAPDHGTGGPGETGGSDDTTVWTLAMNECLSAAGFEQARDGKSIGGPVGDDALFDQAYQDCLDQVGPAPVSAPQAVDEEASRTMQLAQVECLADQGYSIDYPSSGTPTLDLSGVPDDVRLACTGAGG